MRKVTSLTSHVPVLLHPSLSTIDITLEMPLDIDDYETKPTYGDADEYSLTDLTNLHKRHLQIAASVPGMVAVFDNGSSFRPQLVANVRWHVRELSPEAEWIDWGSAKLTFDELKDGTYHELGRQMSMSSDPGDPDVTGDFEMRLAVTDIAGQSMCRVFLVDMVAGQPAGVTEDPTETCE